MRLTGVTSSNLSLHETGSPAYTRTYLAQSKDLELKANTGYFGSLISEMLQASPSDMAMGNLSDYFAFMVMIKSVHSTY